MSITRAARIRLLEVVDHIASLVLLTKPPIETTFHLVDSFIKSTKIAAGDQRFAQDVLEITNACRQSIDSDTRLHLQSVVLAVVDETATPSVSDAERKFLASQYARQLHWEGDGKGINSQLTRAERTTALKMLDDLGDRSISAGELIQHAEEIVKEFDGFYVGFGARFQRELNCLKRALAGHNLSEEHQRIIRGALVYLLEEQDVVPDELGLIGLMDDMYVVRQAATVIDPELTALSDTAEQVLFDLPFLKDFHLENDERIAGYRLSDFALNSFKPISTVLLDPTLTKRVYVRTVQTGAQTILYSILSSLSLISLRTGLKDPQEYIDELPFEAGEKVLIDQKSVAVFEGVETISDTLMLKLRTDIEHEGGTLGSWQNLPAKELGRLMPCDQERVTRGFSTAYITSNETEISPLEQLLHQTNQPVLFNPDRRVFCVCLKQDWDAFYKDAHLFGLNLGRVFPISRINREGEIDGISSSITPDQATMFVAHDIDSLTELVVDGFVRSNDLIIVDATSQESKIAGVLELLLSKANVFIYGGDLDSSSGKFLNENGFTFFDWPDYLASESVNTNSIDSLRPLAFSWEPKLKRQVNLTFDLVNVVSQDLDLFFEAFEKFTKAFRRYQREEGVAEIGNLLIQFAVKAMSSNTLCARIDVSQVLNSEAFELKARIETDHYIPDELKQIAGELLDVWNLKGALILSARDEAIGKLTKTLNLDAVLVAPKWIAMDQVSESWVAFGDFRKSPQAGKVVVFPFWPSKGSVKKIARGGQSSSFIFLLSNGEEKWYRHYQSLGRLPDFTFTNIEPELSHLVTSSIKDIEVYEPVIDNDDLVVDFKIAAASLHAESLVKEAPNRPATTATRLLLLEPEAQVFATDRSHFTVVEAQDGDYRIWERPGNKVKAGDFLLFFSSTDRSVIRSRADDILEEGRRSVAKQWQSEVRSKLKLLGLTNEGFQRRLSEKGLDRHIVTIDNWIEDDDLIAPKKYKVILPIIFEVLALDESLLANIINAIGDVYAAHLEAAKVLGKEVKDQLSQTGEVTTDLTVYTVETVAPVSIEVPYAILSRPMAL